MRGGSESQFDGDVILFVEKNPDYRESYVYANKNRYQDKPLHELHFNIFLGQLNENHSELNITETEDNREDFNEVVVFCEIIEL